ncbi:hypothetical protein BGZ99_000040 [Dissophora globulifera]|uniref:Uncharacterized protein n=1 Tax=Dissophora globulifera TaxID=979702 RepID=A0A9P6RXL9_9FUNG|nr:hypothetical protein BGZ99_000040 [Dissophora globulifera]
MASRFTPQQQRHAPENHFQDGHPAPPESSEWNPYNEQAMKPPTGSTSSNKNWAAPDPYSSQAYHPGTPSLQHQQPFSTQPPRGASSAFAAGLRDRSNSNSSNLSGAGLGQGYGYGNYSGSHMSQMSQHSNSSASYVHPPPQHSMHYQQQQQQSWQYQGYQDSAAGGSGSPSQSYNSFSRVNSNSTVRSDLTATGPLDTYSVTNGTTSGTSWSNLAGQDQQQGYQPQTTYNGTTNTSSDGLSTDYQQSTHPQRQHRPIPSDISVSSVNRAFQLETQQQQQQMTASQSLMQSLEPNASSPHGSPRPVQRTAQKRREQQHQSATDDGASGDLPSLDEYEEMLQKMATPNPGQLNPREARSNLKRTEYNHEARAERLARQARKLQQQQQQPQQQQQFLSESMALPSTGSPRTRPISPQPGRRTPTSEDRKLRRRSSLPTSFGELPSRVMTSLKRRSSGLQLSPSSALPVPAQVSVGHVVNDSPAFGNRLNTVRRSWEEESVAPREDLLYNGRDHSTTSSASRSLLHADDDDDGRSTQSGEFGGQRMEQQRHIRRNSDRLSSSGAPLLTTKSQLRLSRTPSHSDAEESAVLTTADNYDADQENEHASGAAWTKADDTDRQIDQFQLELQQLQNNGPTPPRGHPKSATNPPTSRPRATTPLGMVVEEGSPILTGAPSRQQLLASMDDGGGMSSPNRSTSPNSSRSRSTTPVANTRAPFVPVSAPVPPVSITGGHAPSSSLNTQRKGSPAGRRVKPSPPVSTSILPPTTPRPRAGSIASVSNMASISIDSVLQKAPPSLPLPSLPQPPNSPLPGGTPGDTVAQRRRKASGSKDLVLPTPQLLAESSFAGQENDSLPTPASLSSMSPDMGAMVSPAFTSTPSSSSTPNHQSQILRLKKRVGTLEKELDTLNKGLSDRVRDGSELQFQIEQLTLERDALEKQVAVLQGHIYKGMENEDPEMQRTLKEIRDQRDELLKECYARQDQARADAAASVAVTISAITAATEIQEQGSTAELEELKSKLTEKEQTIQRLMSEQQHKPSPNDAPSASDHLDTSLLLAERSFLEKELADTRDEIKGLRDQLSELETNSAQGQKLREGLELKIEALQLMEETGNHSNQRDAQGDIDTYQKEIATLRSERDTYRQDLDSLNLRLQQEEAQYRTLQDTVQRLNSKLANIESQHATDIQKLQHDHEEVLEKVVINHANALSDLTDQSKTESERGFRKEKQEASARERVLKTQIDEQSVRNDMLEERLYLQEMVQGKLEESVKDEREAWAQTKASLERQLAIEQLQQQENTLKITQVEKENRRLRTILADLDIVALLASSREDFSAGDRDDRQKEEEMNAMYERQRQQWTEQVRLLEHKVAKADKAAAEIAQKNMELMVALDLAQSS